MSTPQAETDHADAPLNMRVPRTLAPVREQVLAQLRSAITEMRLPPGRRLVERELIEQTGTSRTTIREALRQLTAEGLVTSTAHQGTVVASLSVDRAMELYEVRAILEGLAARHFVRHASADQVVRIREAFKAIETAGGQPEPGRAVLAAKKGFYNALFDGAGNVTVQEILEGMQARVTALRSASLAQPGRSAQTIEEIRAIVEALEARDAGRADAACVHHVQQAAQVINTAMNDATTTKETE